MSERENIAAHDEWRYPHEETLTSVLVFVLLITLLSAALAETAALDFTGYSFEELLQIKTDLVEEIARRPGGENMTLGAGQYRIGEDLPAGVYAFKFVQNGRESVGRTDDYVYENESMYRYDVDRLWLGDMPRPEGYLEENSKIRISLYPGEYLSLRYNGSEIKRVGNVTEQTRDYEEPSGTTIPKESYTVGEEIPAGSYRIYYNGKSTARVRVFQDTAEANNSFGKETVLDEANPESIVTLTDGNVFRVEYTPIIMTKGGGFTFD